MTKSTKFGTELLAAMAEAVAQAEGKDVPGVRIHTVDLGSVDAKAVRKKLHLTQDEMVSMLGTSPSGYKK